MAVFEVGEKIIDPCPDGVRFALTDSGAELLVCLGNPTENERSEFTNGTGQFKFAVVNNIIYFLCRFGTLSWMDAPYNVHLGDGVAFEFPDETEGLAMHAMLIDGVTGILIAQKMIGLPHDLSVKLMLAVACQPEIPNYGETLFKTNMMYTTNDLLEIAIC